MNNKLEMFNNYFNNNLTKKIENNTKDNNIVPEYNNYSSEELRILSSPDNALSKVELVQKANLIFQ